MYMYNEMICELQVLTHLIILIMMKLTKYIFDVMYILYHT